MATSRGFLLNAFLPAALTGLLQTALPVHSTPALRVGLVTSSHRLSIAPLSIERGVRLGAAEAKQTLNLFGGDVELFEAVAGDDPQRAAQKLLSERKVQILIGSSASDVEALSRFAESHHLVFMNVASPAPALRAACRRYTFHVEASDSMYMNAIRRAPVGGAGFRDIAAVLWDPALDRYGASQINDRYRIRYRLPMDGSAWAGWVAVKIAAEAALRARTNSVAAILSYLESPGSSFDGHKGWPLSFRLTDHQLRQPLYVVSRQAGPRPAARARAVPELSSMGVTGNSSTTANDVLDQLMPASARRCAWRRQ